MCPNNLMKNYNKQNICFNARKCNDAFRYLSRFTLDNIRKMINLENYGIDNVKITALLISQGLIWTS